MLVALWAVFRRPLDTRVVDTLEEVKSRLAGIDQQISAAGRLADPEARLEAIGATIELGDVLHRTLAAVEALRAVDGSRISVTRPDGTVAQASSGLVLEGSVAGIGGPPDGRAYGFGHATWDIGDADGVRSALVVPIGPERDGSLAVYSRLENAFDREAVSILRAIARRAEPAVQNAFRYLEVQELAATDALTGVGSALAFAEALPREISAARRHGRPLCLLQLDLDNFGSLNKPPHSLDVGDTALAEFGARVRATIRGSDRAFRNSGGADEFFLILPETTLDEAKLLYRRLEFEIATPPLAGVDPPVTMSSGLAELGQGDDEETLRRRAGRAQGIAKANGKNQLVADDDVRMPRE